MNHLPKCFFIIFSTPRQHLKISEDQWKYLSLLNTVSNFVYFGKIYFSYAKHARHSGMDFYLQWKSCFARVQRDHLVSEVESTLKIELKCWSEKCPQNRLNWYLFFYSFFGVALTCGVCVCVDTIILTYQSGPCQN